MLETLPFPTQTQEPSATPFEAHGETVDDTRDDEFHISLPDSIANLQHWIDLSA